MGKDSIMGVRAFTFATRASSPFESSTLRGVKKEKGITLPAAHAQPTDNRNHNHLSAPSTAHPPNFAYNVQC